MPGSCSRFASGGLGRYCVGGPVRGHRGRPVPIHCGEPAGSRGSDRPATVSSRQRYGYKADYGLNLRRLFRTPGRASTLSSSRTQLGRRLLLMQRPSTASASPGRAGRTRRPHRVIHPHGQQPAATHAPRPPAGRTGAATPAPSCTAPSCAATWFDDLARQQPRPDRLHPILPATHRRFRAAAPPTPRTPRTPRPPPAVGRRSF